MLDGERIGYTETPATLELEDGDKILFMQEQTGGKFLKYF
jgi:hypothetical protein|tara:strand:+ start:142 stop:261 length:120 start_codon:yes stop_codon:yes gene_type:complete